MSSVLLIGVIGFSPDLFTRKPHPYSTEQRYKGSSLLATSAQKYLKPDEIVEENPPTTSHIKEQIYYRIFNNPCQVLKTLI